MRNLSVLLPAASLLLSTASLSACASADERLGPAEEKQSDPANATQGRAMLDVRHACSTTLSIRRKTGDIQIRVLPFSLQWDPGVAKVAGTDAFTSREYTAQNVVMPESIRLSVRGAPLTLPATEGAGTYSHETPDQTGFGLIPDYATRYDLPKSTEYYYLSANRSFAGADRVVFYIAATTGGVERNLIAENKVDCPAQGT